PGTDLVVASALFDLVSEDWIDGLVERLVGAGIALLAMLNYSGTMRFWPPHPDDGAVLDAFNRHQRRDKGLGAAAGPEASALLASRFLARGWSVRRGESPWRL